MGFKETRWKRKRTLLVWVAVVLLVLLSAGALVMTRIASGSANPQARQRATVVNTPTKPVTPTPSMTATVTPSPSVTSTATPTALFYEDFIDNSKQWGLTNVPGFVRTMQDDQLVLAVTNGSVLTESIPSTTPFSDFTLNAAYTLNTAAKEDRVGVYVRGDSNLFHDYRVDIWGDNTVTISKDYLDDNKQPQSLELARRSNVSAIHPLGQPNLLTVMLNGPTLSVEMNNVPVISSLFDADYVHGQIALFVNNSSNDPAGVKASFSSIEIDSIPDPLPMPSPTPSVTVTPEETSTETSTPTATPTTGP